MVSQLESWRTTYQHYGSANQVQRFAHAASPTGFQYSVEVHQAGNNFDICTIFAVARTLAAMCRKAMSLGHLLVYMYDANYVSHYSRCSDDLQYFFPNTITRRKCWRGSLVSVFSAFRRITARLSKVANEQYAHNRVWGCHDSCLLTCLPTGLSHFVIRIKSGGHAS